MPAWGSFPLDIYLLEEWDTPHPSWGSETPDERRLRLVRQFLRLGSEGRHPYDTPADEDSPRPTESQIQTVLLPLRSQSLRTCVGFLEICDGGIWLRLCYDDEERYQKLWEENETNSTWVGDDGMVFNEKEIFDGADLARALEIFPERVTNGGGLAHVQWREAALAEIQERIQEEIQEEQNPENANPPEVDKILGERYGTGMTDPTEVYWPYHVACVVAHVFVVDDDALETGCPLHVFLDDCGNVVRQWRVEDGDDMDFDGTWKAGCWKDDFLGRG